MFAYLHISKGISKTNGRKIMSMIGKKGFVKKTVKDIIILLETFFSLFKNIYIPRQYRRRVSLFALRHIFQAIDSSFLWLPAFQHFNVTSEIWHTYIFCFIRKAVVSEIMS